MRIKTKVMGPVVPVLFSVLPLLMVICLLLPGVSNAFSHDQKALVGLKGVFVLVENIRPEAERLGLTQDQIKTDVELRLRKAGLTVLTQKEAYGVPGQPALYVNVNTAIRPGSGHCAFGITVELCEKVIVERGFKTWGATWDTSTVGTVGIDNIRDLRGLVGDLVDKFINDYLAANPK